MIIDLSSKVACMGQPSMNTQLGKFPSIITNAKLTILGKAFGDKYKKKETSYTNRTHIVTYVMRTVEKVINQAVTWTRAGCSIMKLAALIVVPTGVLTFSA